MNKFREIFREVALSATEGITVPAVLDKGEEKDILVIPKQRENGFGVSLECFDYGVYPLAEGWHSGCWDVTVWVPQQLKQGLAEFIDSVLNDAVFEIRYSNLRPYKWIMYYQFEGDRMSDEVGTILFNWFGNRTVKRFTNAEET
ncbi:MAG: hypothetical protein HPY30_11475 [Gammaproteobacteria bacterium (ex Lamellibrachia satsuma)]|nr:MAG: hypothetical protein HPY30_11475 [Gammaproteobacteria bacterium (ex Lamellibrachia satsuma)]